MMLFSLEGEIKVHVPEGVSDGKRPLKTFPAPCPEEPHLPKGVSWASLRVAGRLDKVGPRCHTCAAGPAMHHALCLDRRP